MGDGKFDVGEVRTGPGGLRGRESCGNHVIGGRSEQNSTRRSLLSKFVVRPCCRIQNSVWYAQVKLYALHRTKLTSLPTYSIPSSSLFLTNVLRRSYSPTLKHIPFSDRITFHLFIYLFIYLSKLPADPSNDTFLPSFPFTLLPR